jgi:hypothetical protein
MSRKIMGATVAEIYKNERKRSVHIKGRERSMYI